MAYAIAFAPPAAEQLQRCELAMQRRIVQTLEEEAAAAQPEADRAKRVRRVHVDDHRLVLLELHNRRQMIVLKVADRLELHRRFSGEEEPPGQSPQAKAEASTGGPAQSMGSDTPGDVSEEEDGQARVPADTSTSAAPALEQSADQKTASAQEASPEPGEEQGQGVQTSASDMASVADQDSVARDSHSPSTAAAKPEGDSGDVTRHEHTTPGEDPDAADRPQP